MILSAATVFPDRLLQVPTTPQGKLCFLTNKVTFLLLKSHYDTVHGMFYNVLTSDDVDKLLGTDAAIQVPGVDVLEQPQQRLPTHCRRHRHLPQIQLLLDSRNIHYPI